MILSSYSSKHEAARSKKKKLSCFHCIQTINDYIYMYSYSVQQARYELIQVKWIWNYSLHVGVLLDYSAVAEG